MSSSISRRRVAQGAAWSMPAVLLASTAPSASASTPSTVARVLSGVFVSGSSTSGGTGYAGGNDGTNGVNSDLNWNQATGRPTDCNLFTNGEGSFTPVTNGATGTAGSYTSISGFWWSTPQTSAGAPISGGSSTLASGAQFTTTVSLTVPAGANSTWTLQNIKINNQVWNKSLSGTRSTTTGSGTLAYSNVAGTWNAAAPTITTNADGSKTLTGVITYTTTVAATVTSSGTNRYGQVNFMPAQIYFPTAYGWNDFTLTSSIQSATITESVPAASGYTIAPSETLSGQTTTSTIRPC